MRASAISLKCYTVLYQTERICICGEEKNMKIKLALLDSDVNYLNRIVNAFNTKYAEKFEIYSFTKYENAIAEL